MSVVVEASNRYWVALSSGDLAHAPAGSGGIRDPVRSTESITHKMGAARSIDTHLSDVIGRGTVAGDGVAVLVVSNGIGPFESAVWNVGMCYACSGVQYTPHIRFPGA